MADLSLFGQRIKQLRKELDLSQRDFAEKIGVTASALSAYEKGLKNPSVNVAINIATEFKVSLDWLCGLKKEENRFRTDDIIPFDLPAALNSLRTLIHFDILSIPQTEELEEYGYVDASSLDVSSGLDQFICDSISLDDLYANGAISYENLQICIEEMTFRAAENIRKCRRYELERKKERQTQPNDEANPFA